MKIVVLKEKDADEKRVAIVPDLVARYEKLGYEVLVEKGAGAASSILDDEYKKVGAKIVDDAAKAVGGADVILGVSAPDFKGKDARISSARKGTVLIGLLDPYRNQEAIKAYKDLGLKAFAMEQVPRITRAQSMDVLSSQSNLAGYRAVVDAVYELGSAVPMMMTAAGTVSPAKVLVIGAGVAGLQAIATAKRLGAVVSAFDVRAAVKEQVESLGGKFVEVEADAKDADAETKGGYAREMSDEYKKRQEKAIFDAAAASDIVITTALIPGKPAPTLVSEEMVKNMKEGSVVVDLAVALGGNCPLSKVGKVVEKYGVKIVGYANMPSRVAADASRLYARNLFNFVELITDVENKSVKTDLEEDEITKACSIN